MKYKCFVFPGELEKLGGRVAHIVAPNYEHLRYITDWSNKYPNANLYACPELPKRLKLQWTHEFGADGIYNYGDSENTKYLGLDESFEYVWADYETNPFTGTPFFNEIVFFHKLSGTVFMADLFWNYPSSREPNYFSVTGTGSVHRCSKVPVDKTDFPPIDVPFGTTAWKFGMDKIYLPFYKKLMISPKNAKKYETVVEKIMSWPIRVIAPCHGDLIAGEELCKKVLRDHFQI